MKLRPVKNDRELNHALKRIDELWGAKPNTQKGDELDVLMLLVEKYEDDHYAIPASDPIEATTILTQGAVYHPVVTTQPKYTYRDSSPAASDFSATSSGSRIMKVEPSPTVLSTVMSPPII